MGLYILVMFVAFFLFSDEQGKPFGIDVAKYDDVVFGWMNPPTPREGIPKDWEKCKARWQAPEKAADCIWEKQGDFAMALYFRTNGHGEIRGCSVSHFMEHVARYDLPPDVISVFAERLPHREYWPPERGPLGSYEEGLVHGGKQSLYDQCTSWEAFENPEALEGIPIPCAVRIRGVWYGNECGNLEECRVTKSCQLQYPTLD